MRTIKWTVGMERVGKFGTPPRYESLRLATPRRRSRPVDALATNSNKLKMFRIVEDNYVLLTLFVNI